MGDEMMTTKNNDPARPDRKPDLTGLVRTVRPTLIAAVGGTGVSAAKVAKSRIGELLGPDHHFIAFRAFDTSFQNADEPRLIDNSEYIYLGGFNAQSVIGDILAGHAFPHWAEWLPPRLNFQQVAFGAGGIRPIGRLCYFYRRERVEAAVQEALTTTTDSHLALQYNQRTDVQVNLESGIDIHLVGSICGGTGSGMFLDMAYDLRRWAEAHTDREVTVTGHLVLPEAFRRKPVVLKALEANAYAAMQELDRYMNSSIEDPWTVEYTQGRVERSLRAPFDHCYLLSGLQQGATTDVESLTSVIGETITLLTLSQVGQKVNEGVINMAGQRKSTRDEKNHACCYSSYGVLGLEIPEELLGEALGAQLAQDAHERLGKRWQESEAEQASEVERIQTVLGLYEDRLDAFVPQAQPKLKATFRYIEDQQVEVAKQSLQSALQDSSHQFNAELKQLTETRLWTAAMLRSYATEQAQRMVPHSGGLDHYIKHLERTVGELRSFHQVLLERVRSAEREMAKAEASAKRLETGSLADRDWKLIQSEDLAAWHAFLKARAQVEIGRDQAAQIQALIDLGEREFLGLWRRIRSIFNDLRFPPPRTEEAYYRDKRALTSICPLDWFVTKLEERRTGLLDEVLATLAQDASQWAEFESGELSQQFYELCAERIRAYFRSQSGMTCDDLLAECFDYPSDTYKSKVAVFLARANPNWEMHESYSMRHNLLEISGIGIKSESKLFQYLLESNHRMTTVDEQRPDYIPILVTAHGLSLNGLKRLAAYRQALEDSVFQEQRYDFHFYNDRRRMTDLEFLDEGPGEHQRDFYLFSMAEAIDLIKSDRGYELKGRGQLGRNRSEAHMGLLKRPEDRHWVEEQVQAAEGASGDWNSEIRRQIAALEQALEHNLENKSERGLSHYVYQVHREIRALLLELQDEDWGP